jgi:hypothetical protein
VDARQTAQHITTNIAISTISIVFHPLAAARMYAHDQAYHGDCASKASRE